MKEKIFGAKRTIQRGMVIQLSIAIILVIILSAISLYIFTHQAIAKYMVFNIDTETARNELWKIFRLGIWIIVVNTILISFAIIRISTKILAEPLKKSIEATKKVAEGDFTVRLETKRDDEIKELVDNFNIMVEQLGKTEILQKDFIDNVSHEIKTPINSIQGFTKLLDDNNLSEQERKEYINIIQSNNELLLRLINDILDLSKIESGIIERRKENFNLAKVCNELFVTIQAKMTNPNVELRLDGPNSECWVLLDRNRLKQVWMNFLTNAVKCTKSGYIKMGYGIERKGLRIYVEDTGIGIPDDLHDKVFTRFEKLNEFSQGTGLGLTISRAIVEAAGGEVGFTSKLGVGSTFWAWLPLRP